MNNLETRIMSTTTREDIDNIGCTKCYCPVKQTPENVVLTDFSVKWTELLINFINY